MELRETPTVDARPPAREESAEPPRKPALRSAGRARRGPTTPKAQKHEEKPYAAVSLFSGAGGLDLGAHQTGKVEVVWANDCDQWCAATYRRNIGRHITLTDVAGVDPPDTPCDILLAGPPCQDFSSLWNLDGARTARGNLFRHVARFLATLSPAAFVMENVPGLLAANQGAAWLIVRYALKEPSRFLGLGSGVRYRIRAEVLDFADLGVPQRRERLIVTGLRADLRRIPSPVPRPYAGRHRPVREFLDDQPIPPGAPNHETGLDTPAVIARLERIRPGENYETIPAGDPHFVRGLISHVYRRLDPEKPSYTVIANGGGGTHGYHHTEPRRLSNREKARLQTFPDWFVFEGASGRSAYATVRPQVGNAVPPTAARIIVDGLADDLRSLRVPGRRSSEIARARRAAGKGPAARLAGQG